MSLNFEEYLEENGDRGCYLIPPDGAINKYDGDKEIKSDEYLEIYGEGLNFITLAIAKENWDGGEKPLIPGNIGLDNNYAICGTIAFLEWSGMSDDSYSAEYNFYVVNDLEGISLDDAWLYLKPPGSPPLKDVSPLVYELTPYPEPDTNFVQIDDTTYLYRNLVQGELKGLKLTVNSTDCDLSGDFKIYSVIDTIVVGGISLNVEPSMCPQIQIEKTHNTLQGHYEEVSITTSRGIYEMGGFDFLIAYDASALTATEVKPGQFLEECEWEYFTYNFGVTGNCGNACPSGLLRIVAMAETNNGPHQPLCFGPSDCDEKELAKMIFYVTNDRSFSGQFVPVYFFWNDCGDNTYSSRDGNMLYISRAIYNYDTMLIWHEEYDDEFPEDARIPFVGTPDDCLNEDPDKPFACRCPIFVNGGIDIIHSDSIDARGDINLNGAAYEIADAVVFTNYFIYGLEAFDVNQEGQIAATDVNADGMVLSVADLAYLIRIIIGDALPYAKISPIIAKYDIKDGILSVDQEMGAAYVVIKGNANPVNLTDNMEMKYAYDSENDITRVLLYGMGKGDKFIGSFLKLNDTLTEIEMATYEGATVKLITDLLPKEFSLHQNYPNPFNAVTSILFELPTAAHVEIDIFNVAGRKVITLLDKEMAVGIHNIKWDGVDQSGNQVGSGVYFYKFKAKDYEETRKMMLLK